MVAIDHLLAQMVERNASDLHLTVGIPPVLRIHGELKPIADLPPLVLEDTHALARGLMSEKQMGKFERNREIDFAISLKRLGRFRVNCFFQKGAIGLVARAIPAKIPTLSELNLPAIVGDMVKHKQGLVLFTGPTGSGKSSSLAALIDIINKQRRCHIMTIEDPIEFVHSHKLSVINQRELGDDTFSFAEALKHVLRQDPDVILVGEMRDLETISLAITAAETGHLVFSTLHTIDTAQTIDRIIDVFPPHQQGQVRYQLALVLRAIFAQQLLLRSDGNGRVPSLEILLNTPAVSNLIREGKAHQIYSVLQTNTKEGMTTMDNYIKELYIKGVITKTEALANVHSLMEFDQLLRTATKTPHPQK
ncbi:MAG TPA: type IV pilus twitching motility protein PilT [Firmicutes bacterium]|nr:type IV pilus twitching motility protein PilT [Bacillota bacterium]